MEKSFDQPVESDMRTYDNIKKMLQIKEMTTQVAAYLIIFTSKKTTRSLR